MLFIAFIVVGTCLFQPKDEQAMSATAQAPMWPRLRSFSSPKPSSCAPRIHFRHPHSSQCVFQRTHCRDFGRSHHPRRALARPDQAQFSPPRSAQCVFQRTHCRDFGRSHHTNRAHVRLDHANFPHTHTAHNAFFSAHTAATSVVLITQSELMCAQTIFIFAPTQPTMCSSAHTLPRQFA